MNKYVMLAAILMIWSPTVLADTSTAVPVLRDTPTIKDPPSAHYLGLGFQRSKHLLSFPVLHPAKAFNKGSFPFRHPLMAFKRFGELAEPYQPALNAVSALSGPVTSAGVFTINSRH